MEAVPEGPFVVPPALVKAKSIWDAVQCHGRTKGMVSITPIIFGAVLNATVPTSVVWVQVSASHSEIFMLY